MKKYIIGFVTGAIIFGAGSVFAADIIQAKLNKLPIYVDNKKQNISAYTINGYTYMKAADLLKVTDSEYQIVQNQSKNRIDISKPLVEKPSAADVSKEQSTKEEGAPKRSYAKNGVKVLQINGKEYVGISGFVFKDTYCIILEYDKKSNKVSAYYEGKANDLHVKKLIVDSVPFIYTAPNKNAEPINLVEYDYIENTLMPLILKME